MLKNAHNQQVNGACVHSHCLRLAYWKKVIQSLLMTMIGSGYIVTIGFWKKSCKIHELLTS